MFAKTTAIGVVLAAALLVAGIVHDGEAIFAAVLVLIWLAVLHLLRWRRRTTAARRTPGMSGLAGVGLGRPARDDADGDTGAGEGGSSGSPGGGDAGGGGAT
jgi:uncharacterized membrane protein YgcG